MSSNNYYVYITTNPSKKVFYTGVTNNIQRRMFEHYQNRGKNETFAGKYYCYKLIYFEYCSDVNCAIRREKEIKDLNREAKIKLISETNPRMNFIFVGVEF